MSKDLVTPPWLESLPRDDRGYIIPAEAPSGNDSAMFRFADSDRKTVHAIARACSMCGYGLYQGRIVYRAWAQSDAAKIRLDQRDKTHDYGGPAHLSCILYSMMACPHMSSPTARLGRDTVFAPGAKRGTRAAVMGFADYKFACNRVVSEAFNHNIQPPAFMYEDLVDDRPYRYGEEFAESLEEAILEDGAFINLSATRHYWRDGDELLEEARERYLPRLMNARPEYLFQMANATMAAFATPIL